MIEKLTSALRREKSPANEREELARLNQYYEQEAKRSKADSPELRRWRWKKAVERYIRADWPLSISTIDELWKKLATHHGEIEADASVAASTPLARDAIDSLFDFSTSALVFDHSRKARGGAQSYRDQNSRRPSGMDLQQDVFLSKLEVPAGFPASISAVGELDKFAMAMADLDGYDGVYCLSGVRGSGKSTVLNRIAWYCQHWFDRSEKPLLVRFDLGTVFDREIFIRDLLAEICLENKSTLCQAPHSLSYGCGWLTRAVGYLGRFCQSNVAWAGVLVILLTTILGMNYANGGDNQQSFIDYILSPQDALLLYGLKAGDLRLPLLGLVGSIVLGLAYYFRFLNVYVRRAQSHRSARYLQILARNLAIAILVLLFLVEIFTRYISMGMGDMLLGERSRDSYFICVTLLTIAIVCLPRWWESYLYFDRILARMRSEPAHRLIDTPLLAPLGTLAWFLARVLPSSESTEQVDKISEPFVQELTKQALVECSKSFRRIVVLIDDVDALPSQEFRSIMRLLRPLSKVPGVRCVLSTPLYFHFVLGEEKLGDIHSTVQASIVVGNSQIFAEWPEQPGKVTEDRMELENFLIDLVVSRLRTGLRDIPFSSKEEKRKIILQSPAFRYVLEPWIKPSDDFIFELFRRFGTSRREVLRVLHAALRFSLRDAPSSRTRAEVMKSYGDALGLLKAEYREQEVMLDCETGQEPKARSRERPRRPRAATQGNEVTKGKK